MYTKLKLLLIFPLLVATFAIFAADQQNPSQKPPEAEKQQLSEADKERDAVLRGALKRAIPFNQGLFDILYDSAPEEVKNCVDLINKAFQHDDRNSDFHKYILPSRILLVGPPGVGKSTLAEVIACKLDRRFWFLSMPLLANEYKNSESANFDSFH